MRIKFLYTGLAVFCLSLLPGKSGDCQTAGPRKVYRQAAALLEIGNIDSSRTIFEHLIATYPNFKRNIDAYLILGRMYTESFGLYAKAITMFEKAIADYPKDPRTAHAYFMLGYIYANYQPDHDKATRYFEIFIDKYTAHELRPSAEFELKMLGKTPEDLFEAAQPDSTRR